MSGMNYYESAGEFNPETWDTLKNGSRRATLAGHSQAVAKEVHVLALNLAHSLNKTYDEAELMILKWIPPAGPGPDELNAMLDKYSQKGHPGMRMLNLSTDSGTIMRARQVNKSSKGKRPSNYTPPKKKRK
jgi:hypothetical protein